MKLLVDVMPFDNGKSGISVYCREVVAALVADGHEVTLLAEPGVAGEFFPGLAHIDAPRWTKRPALSMLWHLLRAPALVKRSGCAACLLLAANRRAFRSYPVPTVAVVHDLAQYHVDAKYDKFRMFYIKRLLPHFVRKAHTVVAISKSTAKDLVEHWRIPESIVRVVYNGFTKSGGVPGVGTGGTEGGSILYISRIEHPGKNHETLIEAYGRLPREFAERHPLVLVGGDWNGAEKIHELAGSSPYRDFIRFTGFVPAGDLRRLYAEASCYVFPSRFEGFGLSLLEAMDAGVPCACSKTGSLGEIGEGAAELFDPEDPDDIARAVKAAAEGPGRDSLIAAGRARAECFDWRKCARGLLGSFPKAEVFGVPVDCVTMEEAVGEVAGCVRTGAKPKFFAFVNAHCLNTAYRDAEYAEILKGCDAVWPDGSGVRIAGRILGFPVPANVNGTDLFPMLCRAVEGDGPGSRSVFMFGGEPGVAEKAAENAVRMFPGLRIAGVCDGFRPPGEAESAIAAAHPDILLVALGVPLQEKWIAARLGSLDCGCVLAVGGLLDFVSGRHARAPMWMRRHGIEWMHRFMLEPRRMFRRYIIGNPLFMARVARERRARRGDFKRGRCMRQ